MDDVIFDGENIRLNVCREVYDCWISHRQIKSLDTESFGVLIGSRIESEAVIWIKKCTTPKPNDERRRASFVMRDVNHQKIIDKEFKESKGDLGYIGTWHTHPQNYPVPSREDLQDWNQCEIRNPDRKLIFVIVGYKSINLYVKEKNNIEVISRNINE